MPGVNNIPLSRSYETLEQSPPFTKEYKRYYEKSHGAVFRPYIVGEDLSFVIIPKGHTPAKGDMILRQSRTTHGHVAFSLMSREVFTYMYNLMPHRLEELDFG